jgi:2-oxoglutarate ferredoxin oxidoreductase subunit gamma
VYEGIFFAGFGGQGVILAGKLICLAAMRDGRFVSHIPSYGAEMRGGTANCSVVVSDEEIASPLVPHPSILVTLNTPSFVKFQPMVKPGGVLIYNSSLIDLEPDRKDIESVALPANEIAEELGSYRAANMVALGRLLRLRPVATMESVLACLDEAVSARNKELNAINREALLKGYDGHEG